MTLGGTIDIPKIGPVPKVAVVGVGALAAGYVGYRWWQSRSASSAAATDTTDPGFDDTGTLPAVAGAVSADGSYGGTTGGTGDAGTSQITTNAAWTQYALAQLSATGSYDAGAVAAALGNYLGSQPLSTDQQTIVRAAIAVAGYPPVGTFGIISGGDTGLSIAPSGVSATGVTSSTASITFTGVNGAASYEAYVNGVPKASAASSPISLTGLSQNTSYTVHVVAQTTSGQKSPDSPSVTFKTTVAAVGAPGGLKVTTAYTTALNLSWSAVPNAKGYQILVNGAQNGNTVTYNSGSARSLKPGKTYTIGVRAVGANNDAGPVSTIKATTKKS